MSSRRSASRRGAAVLAACTVLALTHGCAEDTGPESPDEVQVGDVVPEPSTKAWPLVPSTVQLLPDGRTVAASCGGRVCRWPVEGGPAQREGVGGEALAAAAGATLVASGRSVLTVDVGSGEVTGVLEEAGGSGAGTPLPSAVALSDDGSLAASTGADGVVRAWPTAEPGGVVELDLPASDSVGAPLPDPEGGLVAVAAATGEGDALDVGVLVVDAASGAPVAEPEGLDDPLAWSPDGGLLVGRDADGVLGAWETKGWTLVDTSGVRAAREAAVSDDGQVAYVAASDEAGTTIQFWAPGEAYRTQQLRTDHPDPIGAIVWARDGRLLTASSEATAEGGPVPDRPRDEVQVHAPERSEPTVRLRLPSG